MTIHKFVFVLTVIHRLVLHLDRHELYSVFLWNLCCLLKHIHRISLTNNVGAQRVFTFAKGPAVEVMQSDNMIQLFDFFQHFANLDSLGRAFHQNVNALLHDGVASDADDDRKDHCARGVEELGPWVNVGRENVDHDWRNNDTDTEQQVTEDMEVSGSDIDILRFLLFYFSSGFGGSVQFGLADLLFTMTVTMSVIVVATLMSVTMTMCVAIFFGVRMAMTVTVVVRVAFLSVIMIMSTTNVLMKNPNENQIEDQTEHSGDQHDVALNVVFDEASLDCLHEQINRDRKQEDDGQNGADDLRSVPTERQTCRGSLSCQPERRNSQQEGEYIGC